MQKQMTLKCNQLTRHHLVRRCCFTNCITAKFTDLFISKIRISKLVFSVNQLRITNLILDCSCSSLLCENVECLASPSKRLHSVLLIIIPSRVCRSLILIYETRFQILQRLKRKFINIILFL